MSLYLRINPDKPQESRIDEAVARLQNSGVIIYPTDTVYGFGCDIFKSRAVERIAAIKGINIEKANFSFICHDLSHLSDYAKQVDTHIYKLMKKCLPGPFTFILEANNSVPKLFQSKKKTVGIRIPDNKICLEIVKKLGNPLMTSSVRIGGEEPEYLTDPEQIYQTYEDKIDMMIDGGFGNLDASTVVDCSEGMPVVIRQGLGNLEGYV